MRSFVAAIALAVSAVLVVVPAAGKPRGRAIASGFVQRNLTIADDARVQAEARRRAAAKMAVEASHQGSLGEAGMIASLAIAGVAVASYLKRRERSSASRDVP